MSTDINISLTQVVEHFRDVVLSTAGINTWCQTNYSKNASIFVGFNLENPPKKSDSPFIIFNPIGVERGLNVQEIRYTFEVDVGIWNSTYSDINSNGAQEWQGWYHLDALSEIVINAIQGGGSGNIQIDITDYDTAELTSYPLAVSLIDFEVIIPHVLGGRVISL